MISEAFAQVLRSRRDHFNALFAAARHAHPALDADAFRRFLSEVADPIVRAVASVRPDRASETGECVYETALELAGLRKFGPGARNPRFADGWKRLFQSVPRLLAADPRRLLAAGSNALHTLETTPDAQPDEWIAIMEEAGPLCEDSEVWLRLGQVAAWRAGLAHFRAGALAAAASLPEPIIRRALRLPDDQAWDVVYPQLQASPWFDPSRPDTETRAPRIARLAGGFRGFGGPFALPPRVSAAADHFLIAGGDECWVLAADAFGATFHRASPAERAASPDTPRSRSVKLSGTHVAVNGHSISSNGFGEVTSAAANRTTLAFTARLTYFVVLVELPAR